MDKLLEDTGGTEETMLNLTQEAFGGVIEEGEGPL